ncbi:Uncharacterised protein [Mycobacteroides abscessus subsp. abscessus]|nr:Uncharacterised protein [Mycobacteroides abscessus subsp. abscessus]
MSENITVKTMRVTPAVASKWLDRNGGNRNMRAARVERYAADMKAGRWQQNGDTFKFDTTGRLIDGQHRCQAIIESGKAITALVVAGLPAEAAQTIDAGAHRSGADALFFAGEERAHTKDIAAALNSWHAWINGGFTDCRSQPNSDLRLSNASMVVVWEQRPDVAAAGVEARALYQRGLRVPVGALAVALIELRSIDFDVANEFFDRIVELRTSGKGDPIHTFITRLRDEANLGRRIHQSTALFMLFRAWNAFATNQKLGKLQFGSSESGWALIPTPVPVSESFHRERSALAIVA